MAQAEITMMAESIAGLAEKVGDKSKSTETIKDVNGHADQIAAMAEKIITGVKNGKGGQAEKGLAEKSAEMAESSLHHVSHSHIMAEKVPHLSSSLPQLEALKGKLKGIVPAMQETATGMAEKPNS